MEERISLKAVDDYSDDFASKITATFFASHERITGQEILKVTSIPQVNLFVIRELLHAWKHEGMKLRSPYFDYTHPEVSDALTKFQNLLSNHISISKENFQPLLKKSVSQTIYLVVDPYDFFSDTLDRQGNGHVRTDELKHEIKYLKINRAPLEKLVQRMEEKKIDQVTGNEAFGLLDQILEEVNFTPEDVDAFIAQFSEVLPLALDKLYERKPEPRPIAPRPVLVSEEPKKEQPKVNQRKEVKTVGDNYLRIEKIKDNLTINQKFMFTKILFSGDFEIFSHAIDRIDSMDNLKQAMNFIETNYPEWDKESEEYEEFVELVQKRFS